MSDTKVTLTLNGRIYTVACDEGQEKRVQYLAQYIDQKLREASRGTNANTNEAYPWLLTSLVLADELLAAREQLDTAEMDNQQVDTKTQRQQEIDLQAVQHLAQRIEELAAKIDAAA